MEEKLVKVSTYAREYVDPKTGKQGISPLTVYNWIESGKLKSKVIDGVTFVILENNGK